MDENNKTYSKDKSIVKKPIIRVLWPGLFSILGCILSITILSLLIIKATKYSCMHVISYTIYGASIVLLFLFNALYYFIRKKGNEVVTLKKFTHVTGYFYVIGLFIPYMLCFIEGPWGWTMFGVITLLGLLGIIFSGIWVKWPLALRITYLSLIIPAITIAFGLIINKFFYKEELKLFILEIAIFLLMILLRYVKKPNIRFLSYKTISVIFAILLNISNFIILYEYFD